jgi:hypothetical protein
MNVAQSRISRPHQNQAGSSPDQRFGMIWMDSPPYQTVEQPVFSLPSQRVISSTRVAFSVLMKMVRQPLMMGSLSHRTMSLTRAALRLGSPMNTFGEPFITSPASCLKNVFPRYSPMPEPKTAAEPIRMKIASGPVIASAATATAAITAPAMKPATAPQNAPVCSTLSSSLTASLSFASPIVAPSDPR